MAQTLTLVSCVVFIVVLFILVILAMAVKIVRELQKRNILTFLSGNVNGRSIIHQLMEEGVELGYDTYTVPFGTDTISAIYALGFAVRSALTSQSTRPPCRTA